MAHLALRRAAHHYTRAFRWRQADAKIGAEAAVTLDGLFFLLQNLRRGQNLSDGKRRTLYRALCGGLWDVWTRYLVVFRLALRTLAAWRRRQGLDVCCSHWHRAMPSAKRRCATAAPCISDVWAFGTGGLWAASLLAAALTRFGLRGDARAGRLALPAPAGLSCRFYNPGGTDRSILSACLCAPFRITKTALRAGQQNIPLHLPPAKGRTAWHCLHLPFTTWREAALSMLTLLAVVGQSNHRRRAVTHAAGVNTDGALTRTGYALAPAARRAAACSAVSLRQNDFTHGLRWASARGERAATASAAACSGGPVDIWAARCSLSTSASAGAGSGRFSTALVQHAASV